MVVMSKNNSKHKLKKENRQWDSLLFCFLACQIHSKTIFSLLVDCKVCVCLCVHASCADLVVVDRA